MTQKSSDLLAALKKRGVKYITARDMKGAIDHVEVVMGKCWKDARNSRHVAHQMLEDEFVPDYGRADARGSLVAEDYIPRKGEVLTKVIVGYRPMSAQELRERQAAINEERQKRSHKRYLEARRACARRRASLMRKQTAPLVGSGKKKKEKKRFSDFLKPKGIRKFRIGQLSNG